MTTQSQQATAPQTTKPTGVAKIENLADNVLARINSYTETGGLSLPANYSPENALRSAWLMLQEQVDRDNKPVLVSCSKDSIANTLFEMVTLGLNPVKKQCAFVPYAGKLTLVKEYPGSILMAKRAGMKWIKANPVYEKDTFVYEIDGETGRKRVVKHEQDFASIDLDKIIGAYAIYENEDGTRDAVVMNMVQIRKAWMQGKANGASPAHKNFTDEMACKTVIQRACKHVVNSSDDAHLVVNDDKDDAEPTPEGEVKSKVKPVVDFEDAVVVQDEPAATTLEVNQQATTSGPAPVQQLF